VARGDIRVGPIGAIPGLLAEHGLDPARVLAAYGLRPDDFADPENRLPLADVGRLLGACAEQTGCPHFGLLVGQRFTLDALGVLGRLMRNAPTLRDALRMATLHVDLQDRAAVALTLDHGDARAALGYSFFDSTTPAADQILDGTMAIYYRIFQQLCGAAWKPTLVHLSHRRPADIRPLRRFFGPALEFDTRISAVEFDARWLDHRIEGADPAAYAAIVDDIAAMRSRQRAPFTGEVRRALHAMMFTGSASAPTLADLFGLHERALRRRLEAEGATVRGLVSEVRHELARHLLQHTTLPVAEIADILRYSGTAVFSRAFRSQSGTSPTEWRARCAAGAADHRRG
jgi:AraC-like DNA-binding protein